MRSDARFALAFLGSAPLLGCPQLLDDGFGKLQRDAGINHQESGAPDTTPPTVTGSTPGDGARGVSSSVSIEITFSEAMDASATEAAYASPDLPTASVQFSWRERNTILVIQPRQPLSIASGTDPAQVNAQRYTVQLSSQARDLAGNALAPLSISFSAARAISQTLQAASARSLTGNYRSDDQYGLLDCQETGTHICVGDGVYAASADVTYRGFLTFDLSGLPSDRLALLVAELSLTVSLQYGDPFATLGALQLEKMSFERIAMPAFEQTIATSLGALASNGAAADTLNADVLSAVQADEAARRTQYRLRFDTATDSDNVADVIVIELSAARLRVTYSMP